MAAMQAPKGPHDATTGADYVARDVSAVDQTEIDMTRIHNPPHPGETLREDVLPVFGLSVTEAAMQLGVTRAALSRVLNGRAAISPEMALRLEGWLGVENGGRADLWVSQQAG